MMRTQKQFQSIVFKLLIAFFLLFMVVETQIRIPCVVCGKTAYTENILCRIAAGFDPNFMHERCVKGYKENFVPETIDSTKTIKIIRQGQ